MVEVADIDCKRRRKGQRRNTHSKFHSISKLKISFEKGRSSEFRWPLLAQKPPTRPDNSVQVLRSPARTFTLNLKQILNCKFISLLTFVCFALTGSCLAALDFRLKPGPKLTGCSEGSQWMSSQRRLYGDPHWSKPCRQLPY